MDSQPVALYKLADNVLNNKRISKIIDIINEKLQNETKKGKSTVTITFNEIGDPEFDKIITVMKIFRHYNYIVNYDATLGNKFEISINFTLAEFIKSSNNDDYDI